MGLDSMMKEVQGRYTIVVIAHRLSTIKDADKIVVLDEGTVAEQGSHEELLRKDGRYATMISRQLHAGAAAEEEGSASPEKAAQDAQAHEGLQEGHDGWKGYGQIMSRMRSNSVV